MSSDSILSLFESTVLKQVKISKSHRLGKLGTGYSTQRDESTPADAVVMMWWIIIRRAQLASVVSSS